jgi:hypothetical protein
MKLRSAVFAVAITAILLMALTTNLVSAEPPAKVKLNPGQHKVELNPSEQHMVELNLSEPMTFTVKRAYNDLVYDDGTAETAYAWNDAGNGFAVRFTPLSYPADLLTARICFWPDCPDSDHEEFAVYVYDDDGPSGEPGTCLGGPIYHTATAWGWCAVDISGLGITITSGDFYILYHQLTDFPDCEYLCVDLSPPQYGRSWSYYDGSWEVWHEENYMIRCLVDSPAVEKSWTFMVYLDGDNDLELAAIDNFMKMSFVGSTSEVNIVVQFDRIDGYCDWYENWTDCKRFYITKGITPTAASATMDLDECNMGDPNTLRNFVEWAMSEYPAEKYALILWDHGSGWKKKWVPWKDDTGIARWVCLDITNSDYLTLQETEQALTGKYIDLLGYNACLMHLIEVVYQMVGCSGESVGAESVTYVWPYHTILEDLTGNPTMTSRTLGATIVQRYIESRSDTQSAVDEGDVPSLVTAVDNLAQVLISKLPGSYNEIQQARNNVQDFEYDGGYKYYIDLYDFAELIKEYVPDAGSAAQAVMDNVNTAVYAEEHGTDYPNAHGLSIYFPGAELYLCSYKDTKFAIDTHWDEFLKEYCNAPNLPYREGVFRNGRWILRSCNPSGAVVLYRFKFGRSTDIPVTGDWDGDGVDTIGVYRNGRWLLRNSNSAGPPDYSFKFGRSTDIPVTGDWNGDGVDTIGVRRGKQWILRDSNSAGSPDYRFRFGRSTDIPVTDDWNGDGIDTIGVRREVNNGSFVIVIQQDLRTTASSLAGPLTYLLPGTGTVHK